jgi:biotin carboxylase
MDAQEETPEPTDTAADPAPVMLVGYSGPWIVALGTFMPDGALIIVDEPDVVRKRDVAPTVAEQPVVRELIQWDYQADGAADRFANAHPDLALGAILPMVDYSVPFAARLSERYGLPGTGLGAARLLRDKHLLREVIAAAGIPNPQSVPVDSPEAVRQFMAQIGGPIVLKPANRQSSLGTTIITTPAEIDSAWAYSLAQDEGPIVPDRPIPLLLLAERYLRGEEFSVEMLVARGRPVFGAPTRKFLFEGPHPVEQGHLHPADIPADLSTALVDGTARVAQAVGVDTAVLHCEWIVEDGVPHLVECAGRMAGDHIIELVIRAWGYFIFGEYLAAMRGEELTAEPPQSSSQFAAAWFAHVPPGEVEAIDGIDDARGIEGVHTVAAPQIGSVTGELRSSWDRQVASTAVGTTPEEALHRAQAAVGSIKVSVRPAAGPPA